MKRHEITCERETITKEGKKIIQFGTIKQVKTSGTGGAVTLPKALIGKYVEVYYMEEKQ